MAILMIVLQLVVALGLLNVWLVRAKQATAYRGKNAKSIQEEFAAYGLPAVVMWIVGILKVGIAIALILGIWMPTLVSPAASVLVILMLGAIAMHMKVNDPIKKSVPAICMLAMAIALVVV